MSMSVAFREIEKSLEDKLGRLESLKSDPSIKQEIDFEEKLLGLMVRYKITLNDLKTLTKHDIFGSKAHQQDLQAQEEQSSYHVPLRTYQHPVTQEILKVRGKNLQLKAWEKKYGFKTVNSWLLPGTP